MTEKEKANKLDALIQIKHKIGGCFGAADGIFAGHTLEEKRAKELRELASNNGITLYEVQDIALGYLYRKSYLGEHILEQMQELTKYFGKKT